MTEEDMQGFQWMNPPEDFILSDGKLQIVTDKGTDFFNNPENEEITATAPLLFRQVEGDFVAIARVQPDFADTWNAAALMIHIDSTHWIKLAFENSDATGKSIVSVVTRESSDDANGVRLFSEDAIWLQVARKGDIYAMHWSEDGADFKMARLSRMPAAKEVKVGMEAQCPVGGPAKHKFLYFSLVNRTVEDLRKGS